MKSQKKHHFQKKAMHFKSPLAMGQDAFKSKHASSVSISEVIDTGVNSNDKTSLTKIKGELIYE